MQTLRPTKKQDKIKALNRIKQDETYEVLLQTHDFRLKLCNARK